MTPLLHNISGSVEVLGISRTRLFEEIKLGNIATVKIGKRTMIKTSELERYVAELQSAA